MISLTNYDFQWGRSEVVIIYPDSIINIYQLWSTKTQRVSSLCGSKSEQTIHAQKRWPPGGLRFFWPQPLWSQWVFTEELKMGVSKNAGVFSIPQNIHPMFFNQKNDGKIGTFANGWVWVSSIFSPTFLDKPRSLGSDCSQPNHPVELPLGNQRRVLLRQLCRENILKSLEEQCTNHTKIS